MDVSSHTADTRVAADAPASAGRLASANHPVVADHPAAADKHASSDQRVITDPRALKTQKMLRDALITLMEGQGLAATTINDICAQAKITRATFYNHFRTKEEMVAAYEQEILDSITQFQDRMAEVNLAEVALCQQLRRPMPLIVDLFDYLRSQGDMLHALFGPGGDPAFGGALRDCILTNMITSVMHEQYRDSDDPFITYYVAYFSAAVLGVIIRWVQLGMKEDSEQMAVIILRLFEMRPGRPIKT